MATQQIEVDNKSKFKVTFIQVDEYGETVKAKLESEHEHRYVGRDGTQTLWMSAELKRRLGVSD